METMGAERGLENVRNTYPKMMLQRDKSIVAIVNTRVRVLFDKCTVDSILTESILAQTNRVRVSAADLCVYLSRGNADATAFGA